MHELDSFVIRCRPAARLRFRESNEVSQLKSRRDTRTRWKNYFTGIIHFIVSLTIEFFEPAKSLDSQFSGLKKSSRQLKHQPR